MEDAFSIYLIPPILSLFFGGYLAFLALVSVKTMSPKGRVLFALVCLWYSLLSPIFICHHLIGDQQVLLSIERKVHFFYVYLPVVVVLFLHHMLAIRRRNILIVLTVLSFLFSLATQSQYYIPGLNKYSWGYIAKGGVAFQLFGLYGAVALGYCVISFVRRIKLEPNPALRLRFKYVAVSFGMSALLTFLNIPAMLGVDFYPPGNFSFFPLAILAYGLFKYRLVEIRSLLHVSFIRAILYLMVLVPNFLLFQWGASIMADQSGVVQFAVLSVWFLLNNLYLTPIRALARRWLYKSRNELQKAEAHLMKEMLVLCDADDLAQKVRDAICLHLPFRWIRILSFDISNHTLASSDGMKTVIPVKLAKCMLHIGGVVERTSLGNFPEVASVEEPMRCLLKDLNAAYAIPLVHNETLVGLMVMPIKTNLQSLHSDEAAFIKNISHTLALALSNAIMYQSISTLKDNLQIHTDALTSEISERKRAEEVLHVTQHELQQAHEAMEEAILQANEMAAKMEINNHVLTQEMEGRKKVEQALRQSEAMYRLITENSTDVIWTIDMEGRFTFISPSVRHLLDYTSQEMLALEISAVLTPESLQVATDAIGEELESASRPDARKIQARTIELEQVRKDGSTLWTEVNTRFLRDENRAIVGILGVTRDISERRKSEQDLIYIAYHDTLTGLYNRKAFIEFLEKEIKYAKRYGSGLGLLFFDLDKFKQVNDTFGHEIGDRLLKGVANRLMTVVRETDLVARLGGDEFTIILKNPDTVFPEIVAQRIAQALSNPFEFGDILVDSISASIGIASFPKDGTSVITLMKNADLAMYKAKESAADWVFYSDPMVQAV